MKSFPTALLTMSLYAMSNLACAAPAKWEVKVTGTGDKIIAQPLCKDRTDLLTCLQTAKVNVLEENSTLTVTCDTVAVCENVSLGFEKDEKRNSPIDADEAAGPKKVFSLEKALFGPMQSVGIFHNASLLLKVQIGGTAAVPNTAETATRSILFERELRPCPKEVTFRRYPRGREGSASKQIVAQILVDPTGNVLAKSPGFLFDENDTLEVNVIGRRSVVSTLKVTRTSSFRDLSVVRVLGDGVAVVAPGGERHSTNETDPCVVGTYALDNFAPGQGTVQISSVTGDTTKPVGSFDFQVHPLYVGMFTLGWVRTETVDPGFKLVSDGQQNVIAPADVSDKDNLFTLFYTPFVWGKRDLEKPWAWDASLLERVNPTIGLVIDDLDDNVLAGISIDLPAGVVITAGRHYRRISVLSTQSGLTVGSPFTGTADQLPTAKSWESENFIGLSIDLRVMAKFISTAIGSAGE